MKRLKALSLAFAVAAAFAAPAYAGNEAHEHAAGEAKLVLDHGRKWQTDAPLRQGMENIRAAVAKEKDYDALAKRINAEVAGIVQNCKLEPQADAQLHIVVADLVHAAEVMEGKVKGAKPRAGKAKAAQALDAYGRHFDHAGWKPL